MPDLDDNALLREYVEHDSEHAFAALVERHVDKVYSIALRLSRNPHHAEEITQAVFVVLARKSRTLSRRVILSGWLCRTARLTAITLIRSEIRRARREHETHMQTLLNEADADADAWRQIAPCLDDAMAGLNRNDHHAVVLRFFDGKSMKEVGAALGTSEDAAKQRVGRAIDKLRHLLSRRGVVVSAGVLASAMSGGSIEAAPAPLSQAAAAAGLTQGAAAGVTIAALADGTGRLLTFLKLKTPVLAATTLAYAAGISMRELTLVETGCLGGLLLLSLLLPMMMSLRYPRDPAARISCLRIVWTGQSILALAGLLLLFSTTAAVPATLAGAAGCIGCAVRLRRHLYRARPPAGT